MSTSKQISEIAFSGMERINERINTADGVCEEIINLRPKGNTWQNIFPRRCAEKINISQGNIFFTNYRLINHPASHERFRIVWDKTHGINHPSKVVLFTFNSSANEWQYYGILHQSGDNILSVSYLDNILTVCTENDKYFYLWKDNNYIPLNLSSLRPVIRSSGIKITTGRIKQYSSTTATTNSVAHITRSSSAGSDPGYASHGYYMEYFYPERLPGYIEDAFDYSLHGDRNDHRDRFRGLSLYRVAIELADGSFTSYSNIDFADVLDTYGDAVRLTFQSEDEPHHTFCDCLPYRIKVPEVYGYHNISVKLTDTEHLKSLMRSGVIKNISLFMTPPQFAYDTADYDHYNGIWAWDHTSEREKIVGNNVPHHTLGISYGTKGNNGIGAYVNAVFLPINKGITEVFNTGAFYRVRTFDQAYFENIPPDEDFLLSDGELRITIKEPDIRNLTANTPLPTPNVSEDNKVLFSSSYTYNKKQHLYNLSYTVFKGFFPYSLSPQDNYLAPYGYFFFSFSGNYNGHPFTVSRPFPVAFINNNRIHIPSSELFQYPMLTDIIFEIYVKPIYGNTKKIIYRNDTLSCHTGQNTSFANPLRINYPDEYQFKHSAVNNVLFLDYGEQDPSSWNVSLGQDSIVSPVTSEVDINTLLSQTQEVPINPDEDKITLTNVLQLTQTDNPLITPNEYNYSFGENDNVILSVISNTGTQSTTDRNFGLYPLYVFCSDGIYVMQTGSADIAYSSVHKISDERIVSPYTCNTPSGIVFLSESGLYLISQKGLTNIGSVMNGRPTLTRTSDSSYYDFISEIEQTFLTPPQDISLDDILCREWLSCYYRDNDFLTQEIPSAMVYYDTVHSEIVFSVKPAYSYVYNLQYKCWYKRSDAYQVDDPQTLSLSDPNYIGVYSMGETPTLNDISLRPHIITKPLLLSTRHYQHIERIIFNFQWRTSSDDFWLFVFGSFDGVYYNILKAVHQTPDTDLDLLKQDYYLSRTLRSHKYIFLCIFAKHLHPTRIGYVLFSDKYQRNLADIK